MDKFLAIFLLALLTLGQTALLPAAFAADAAFPARVLQQESTVLPACPSGIGQDSPLAQISLTDCCKGKKGVCGCRAGKIVCCDGSISKVPNCTCHGDSGIEN